MEYKTDGKGTNNSIIVVDNPIEKTTEAKILTDPEKISELLGLKLEDFDQNCVEMHNLYESKEFDKVCELLVGLTSFMSANKQTIEDNAIDVSKLRDSLVSNNIGEIILEFISLDLSSNTENIKYYAAAIRFIAVISWFPYSDFSFFLSGARLYPTIFLHFLDTDNYPSEDDLILYMLACIINLSKYETNEEDAFQIFKEDSYEASKAYIEAFNTRNTAEVKRGDVTIRVFTEIARHHAAFFDVNACKIIVDFMEQQYNKECLYTAFQFATFIIQETKYPFMEFFELFTTPLSIISTFDYRVHNQGMTYLNTLLSVLTDPTEIASVFFNVPIGIFIKDGIRSMKTALSALTLAQTCISTSIPASNTGFKKSCVWLFELILPCWGNSTNEFILYLLNSSMSMGVEGKIKMVEVLGDLIEKSAEAMSFMQTSYDFEIVGDLLDSEESQLSLATMKLIKKCIQVAARNSEKAFNELMDRFDEAQIPDSVELLTESEDNEVAEAANEILELVNQFNDDSSDGD